MKKNYTVKKVTLLLVGLLIILGLSTPAFAGTTSSISGRATLNGSGLAGVSITIVDLSGAINRTGTSDANGYYTVSTLPIHTNYNLIPSKGGYVFNPSQIGTAINTTPVTVQDFAATENTFSGRIMHNDAGLSGVIITAVNQDGGATYTATSDSSGNYTLHNLQSGIYTWTPKLDGYTFTPASRSSATSGTITGMNFAAARKTFVLTVDAGSHGTISPGTTSVNSGANQTFAIAPATGYVISSVLVDGSSVGAVASYTFSNIAANHTISATFAINTYTITASAASNGVISPAGQVAVGAGATQSFTITPNANYWSLITIDGVDDQLGYEAGTKTYTFTNVQANHTITISFLHAWTITSSAGANGTITPSGTIGVKQGATKTYTITPSATYKIQDVLVDGASVGAVASYTFSNIAANHTISVTFTQSGYSLTIASGFGGIARSPDKNFYNPGEQVTITVTPNTGYAFTGWSGDLTGTTNPAIITMNSNKSIVASFTLNTITVTVNRGTALTTSPRVRLTISSTGTQINMGQAVMMRFSNDLLTLTSAPWVPYATTKLWILDTAVGSKTVYAQFKDTAGTTTPLGNDCIHASITLGNPPKSSIAGRTSSGSWYMARPTANGFESILAGSWNAGNWSDVQAADFDGDGMTDLAGRTDTGAWYVTKSLATGLTNTLWSSWDPALSWTDVIAGDFNGDGKADIAGRTSAGDWYVMRSTGTSFINDLWGHWDTTTSWRDVKVADVNGDGQDDIIGWNAAGEWWVARSTGTGFVTERWMTAWVSDPSYWRAIMIGDVNGDGMADIIGYDSIGNLNVARSTGTGFVHELWGLLTIDDQGRKVIWQDIQTCDVNGDYMADVVARSDRGDWYVLRSDGTTFVNEYWGFWSTTTWHDVQTTDINGDGLTDIVGRNDNGDWCAARSTGSKTQGFINVYPISWNAGPWADVQAEHFYGVEFNAYKVFYKRLHAADQAAGLTISGTVTRNGSGLAGVTITADTQSTTTAADGTYTIANLQPGTYFVTPLLSGYLFNPTTLRVILSNSSSVGQDFVATAVPAGWSVSGRVTLANGTGISGLLMGANPGGLTYTGATDINGNYTINGLPNGSISIYPDPSTYNDYSWNPELRYITINNASQSGVNFIATPLRTISGRITLSNSGISNISVTASTSTGFTSPTAYTDANGNYTIIRVPDGTYTVTPSNSVFTFTPSQQSVTLNGVGPTGVNFTANAITYILTVITSHGTVIKSPNPPYTYNQPVTLTAIPDAGYSFGGWTGATPDANNPAKATVIMSANKTVTATFTAIVPPAAPANLRLNGAVTATSVPMIWDAATGATTYTVKRSVNNGAWVDINIVASLTCADTTVTPDTNYRYQIYSWAGVSSTTGSNILSVTTPPKTPANLRVNGTKTSASIPLSWDAVTGSYAYYYAVRRSADNGATWIDVVNWLTTTTYTNTGLSPNKTYKYQVVAQTGMGILSAGSNIVTETTSPSAPINLRATGKGNTNIQLAWDPSTGAEKYILKRSLDGITYTEVNNNIATTAYNDIGLSPAITYYYQVFAYAAAGGMSAASNTLILPTAPWPPQNLRCTGKTSNSISLTWNAAGGAQSYIIRRSLSGANNWTMVAQPTATAYTDPGLASSTAYDYRVSAYNGVGVGGESGFAGLTETTLVAPPPAPANLRLNGTKTVSSIPVAWNAVAGIGLTYTLKRSADGGTTWVNAGTNLTATAYTDTGLTFNTSYKYQVFAVSSTGLVSDGSNLLTTSTNPGPYSIDGYAYSTSYPWNLSGAVIYVFGNTGKVATVPVNYSDRTFTVSGLIPGMYTLIPYHPYTRFVYTRSINVTITSSSVSGINFAGTKASQAQFMVIGRIVSSGIGLVARAVDAFGYYGRENSGVSDSLGYYAIDALRADAYNIIPREDQFYSYQPRNLALNVGSRETTNANFVAIRK